VHFLDNVTAASGAQAPLTVGDGVVVSPGASLLACTLQGRNLIGAAARVLEGAVVEQGAIVGPGAVVEAGARVGAGQLWAGRPARLVRQLTEAELSAIDASVAQTGALATQHAAEGAKSAAECIDEMDVHQIRRVMREEEKHGLNSDNYHDYVPNRQ
jgi:carbonic anhydrase/acetyltransferase-like protein (isoleucine patch superfamily)